MGLKRQGTRQAKERFGIFEKTFQKKGAEFLNFIRTMENNTISDPDSKPQPPDSKRETRYTKRDTIDSAGPRQFLAKRSPNNSSPKQPSKSMHHTHYYRENPSLTLNGPRHRKAVGQNTLRISENDDLSNGIIVHKLEFDQSLRKLKDKSLDNDYDKKFLDTMNE